MNEPVGIVGPARTWITRANRAAKLLRAYRGVSIVAGKSDIHKAVVALEDVTKLGGRVYHEYGGSIRNARADGYQAGRLHRPLSLVWHSLIWVSRGRGVFSERMLARYNPSLVCPDALTGQRSRACWYARKLADLLEEQTARPLVVLDVPGKK